MKPQSRPPFSEIVYQLERISVGQQAEQTGPVEGACAKMIYTLPFSYALSQGRNIVWVVAGWGVTESL